MDSGDPNIIDKVFSEILAKTRGLGFKALQDVLELVNKIDDAMRHLRNYAKKRKDNGILEQMIKFQQAKQVQEQNAAKGGARAPSSNNQISLTNDFTQPRVFIEEAYR